MRGNKMRFASAVLLAALSAWLVTRADRVASAQPGAGIGPVGPAGKAKDKEKDKDKDLRPLEDHDIPFGFPYERDATNQLKGARDYLAFKEIPWNTVSPLLQNILDAKSDSFFNINDKAGEKILIRRISVKTEANRIIAAFPKEGLEFYQQSYGQAAATLLDEAVKGNYDLATLSDLSQRYFHTNAGAEGTILLGTLYLERGNYLEAAYAFERLLARPNTDDFLTPRTLFKAALALRRGGDPRHAALAQAVSDRLQKATARTGLVIGRRTFTTEHLKAELERPVTTIRAAVTAKDWAGRYGNAQRNATVEGGPPFLVPAFDPTPMLATRREDDKPGNDWIAEELNRLFDRENKTVRSLPLPAFFPVTTPDLVIYRGYDGIHAIATRDHTHAGQLVPAGKLRWSSKTMFGVHQLMTPGNLNYNDPNIRAEVTGWWGTYKTTGVSSLLFENPLLGSLAHDGQTVFYVDDVAIPPPPAMTDPNFGGMPNQQVRQSGELADAIRAGELSAVDIATGMRVWTLGRVVKSPHYRDPALPRLTEEEADKSTDAFHLCLNAVFLGPPLPLNGRLYVLIELDGVSRLLCLDPKTLVPVKDWPQKVPAVLWTQKLGRPNTPLPGDSVRRYQGVFLAAGEGILVCPTNSGAMIGVDIMSRSLLWAHAYRRLEPNTLPKQPVFTPTGPVLPPQLPVDRWRGAAPIVSGGRVVIAAYDSNKLECIDVRSGKVLWSVPREATDLYVGGVTNDRVIVVSKGDVRAYHLTGENPTTLEPKLAWRTPLPSATPTGHGVAGKAVYYIPVRQENAGKDTVPAAEIWAVNVETGAVTSKTAARMRKDGSGNDLARYGLGNLVFQDGLVIAQSAWEVAVYPQLEQKKAEMDRRLKANPKDPEGLTDRGELLLDDGQLKAAVADFKEAERNNPTELVRRRVREKLYVAYTEMLRDNFGAAEGVLKEYEALCELPLDDTGDPFEKKRREDETLRRKRLYLYLLAKGREDQKRLGEAFDHYLALAGLGEGKTLFEMPDEPSVRMRPDVWARGRIEGMIRRAADPAARKSLEDRVNKEWEAVDAGNDLKRLREFVDVFGPYFPAGSAAELKLAHALLQTNTDEDTRDAQVHLSQLRVTAEAPVLRAKATEALARLMIKNGLLEDAVGLYLQLGKEYPEVVVRDGKTGADFLVDLLTDKRLLPYLEPARYPLPPRVKAEQKEPQPQSQAMAAVEVDPDGDLFPMFRRLRFVMDMVSSGNNTWTFRGLDRVTGAERCRFPDIHPPMQYNPGNLQAAKYVQASGHLLLVQVGQWVYCLDLAEKKERWRKNLLGEGGGPNPNQIIDNAADGEVVVQYTDGSRVIIGKSAVLQPGYVCLLTRDGLEVVEPVSRRQLWTRRNVADRTHVYGDARYILLVETGADRKPVATKLLRAVDGMPVDGATDAGRTLAAARSYRVSGRTVLLAEGTGDEPHVLRLLDLSTGKDIWRKEYDAKAVPLRSPGPDWTGFVKPTGEVEILSTRTGQSAGAFRLDPKYLDAHLKGCVEAQLFADADRFYVVLDRSPAGGVRQKVYGAALRTHTVNGPMYAFDRVSGKRLWFVEAVFDNQWMLVDRFAELPVIVAAAPMTEANGNMIYKVVVVEKGTGAVRFRHALNNTGNFFQNMTVDLKNGTIDLHRYDTRVHIGPDERPGEK
ncbi:MAG: bamB 1 [Gemmataceae bacterium]|nr:bamB 1 [Gemmataceae bacterium]